MTVLPEPSLRVIHVPEPMLGFGHDQLAEHPKDGLVLYGPLDRRDQPAQPRLGAIGTPEGVAYLEQYLGEISRSVEIEPPKKTDKKERPHLSNFPGLEEAFGLRLDLSRLARRHIDIQALDAATRQVNHHEAVASAAAIYIGEVEAYARDEEQDVDLWILVLPEFVYERCRPKSQRRGLPLTRGGFGRRQKAREDLPLLAAVLDQSAEEIFDDIPDFHRHVKARLLRHGKTSQLFRETTLAPEKFLNQAGYPERPIQDRSSRAWNAATALYYKTQPQPPWKLAQVRPGVCYIGLVYKLIPNHPQEHACCAAQMFLNEGDGLVFRGANGPWKTGRNEFHLPAAEARSLISTVIKTFVERHGFPPKEFFIHGRTTFRDEEWNAFATACPPETNLIGVRIRQTDGDVKLFRDGDYPAIRGTAMILDDRNAYLWTSGYMPRMATYIGPETPNPVHVTVLRSTGSMPEIGQVLSDILGLTKINYNTCNFGDALPVTVRFASKVGDVLVMAAARQHEKQPFKFYI